MIVLIALLLALLVPGVAAAQEARCAALDAQGGAGTCICSEPMNTSTFTLPVSDWTIGFPDGGTKKCAYLNIAGVAGEIPASGRSGYAMSSSASVLNALRSGSVPSFVFAGNDSNSGGALLFGHSPLPQSPIARVAMRWYKYHSPNFELGGTGSGQGCYNSGKEAVLQLYSGSPSIGALVQTSSTTRGWQIYSWGSSPFWQPGNGSGGAIDCCEVAPGQSTFSENVNNAWEPAANDLQGRWLRHEYVISNVNAGAGLRLEYFIQDVTIGLAKLNGGTEFRVLDSSVVCLTCQRNFPGWTAPMTTELNPVGMVQAINIDGFRQVVGLCGGFAAYSHMLAAKWTTNTGQRIGAASEVESGGGATPPAAPTGLRFASLVLIALAAGALAWRGLSQVGS
jgi:hypothetical protein